MRFVTSWSIPASCAEPHMIFGFFFAEPIVGEKNHKHVYAKRLFRNKPLRKRLGITR